MIGMLVMSARPGDPGSAAAEERPEPRRGAGELLVGGVVVGLCGTDRDVIAGRRGRPPEGRDRIVIGHESLGRVLAAPPGSGFEPGDLVAGVVRRPDPLPCARCAAGEWDSCLNGGYRSRGITGLDGYGAQRWCVEPAFAVKVDPRLGTAGVLVEPASVLVKAWRRIERFAGTGGGRVALVMGAGPMGVLAALLAVRRGYTTHVLARRWPPLRSELVAALGAAAHEAGRWVPAAPPDVVVDTTGAAGLIADAVPRVAPNAVVCLVGLSPDGPQEPVRLGPLTERLVTANAVLFGSVNAAYPHYSEAVAELAAADPGWLRLMVSRRVPLTAWPDGLRARDDDMKVLVDLEETPGARRRGRRSPRARPSPLRPPGGSPT
jgi:threonine dehydrogenase-like Zn-dependent dehydrogenase